MAINFEDSLYGFIIGGVLGEIMSNVASINNQLDKLPQVKSPKDASMLDLEEGEWFHLSSLMLDFVSHIHDTPEEHSVHPVLYTSTIALYYCNNIKQSLQYLDERGSDIYSRMWVSIIDFAIHAVQKKHIFNRKNYAFLPETVNLFNFDYDSMLPERGNNIEEQMKIALQAFYSTSTFVDGMIHIINYVDAPQIPSFLYGQLAGAYYGFTDIPTEWISTIKDKPYIDRVIGKLSRTPAVMFTIQSQAERQSQSV